MLSVTFLGTSAARPTVERNVSAMALVREGETLLFECGEGTQRQMMRYGVSFALSEIFFTHFHADHFLGVIGLIRTLGLQARAEPMRLYGPKGAKKLLGQAIQLGVERVPFNVDIIEVKPGEVIRDAGGGRREAYEIHVFGTEHGGGSVGYALREHERRGRFDVDKARAAGIPEGPLWGKLRKGETVQLPDGGTGGHCGGQPSRAARGVHRRYAALCRGGGCGAGGGFTDSRGDVWGGGEGAGQGDGAFDGARGSSGSAGRESPPSGAESRFGSLFDQCRGIGQRSPRNLQGNNCR